MRILCLILIMGIPSIFNYSFSQNDNSVSGDSSDIASFDYMPKRSPNTGEFFRVLILYVAFSDDTTRGPSWNIWPNNSTDGHRPINPYTNNGRLIDTSEMSNYTDYT